MGRLCLLMCLSSVGVLSGLRLGCCDIGGFHRRYGLFGGLLRLAYRDLDGIGYVGISAVAAS
jgi:hypothetical protein